jgi:hypothetical protein
MTRNVFEQQNEDKEGRRSMFSPMTRFGALLKAQKLGR